MYKKTKLNATARTIEKRGVNYRMGYMLITLCNVGALLLATGCTGVPIPPLASAPADRNVDVGTRVELSAQASTDLNGTSLTYLWQQTSGPNVDMTNPNGPETSFVPNEKGVYCFALTVSNGSFSDEDTVCISVAGNGSCGSTIASAGANDIVNENRMICLDGGNSANQAGLPLGYEWAKISGPETQLPSPFDEKLCITAPDVCGDQMLVFELTVTTEDFNCRATDEVVITIRDLNGDCCVVDADCNDQRPCTEDTCVDTGSCVFTPFPGDEGLFCDEMTGQCGVVDACAGVTCDDFNQCTNDTCNPTNGSCDNILKDCGNLVCDTTTGQCVQDPDTGNPVPICESQAPCLGSYTGTFSGIDQGEAFGALSDGGIFEGRIISKDTGAALLGTVSGTVASNGEIAGSASNGTQLSGFINFTTCHVDGSYKTQDGGSGTWSMTLETKCVSGCNDNSDCDDEDPCTSDDCQEGSCRNEAIVCEGDKTCEAGTCVMTNKCDRPLRFSTQELESKGDYTSGISIHDMDLDGNNDVIVTNPGYYSGDTVNVGILIAARQGELGQPRVFQDFDAPSRVVPGDIDQDGWPDVAVSNFGSDDVTILYGAAAGVFDGDRTQALSVGDGPTGLKLVDLNVDGWLDLVVVNTLGGSLTIFLNDGSGKFNESSFIDALSNPREVISGDFDSDDCQDLVVTNSDSGSISLLSGFCDGTFATQQTIYIGKYTRGLAVGDFDFNGTLDLAVGGRDYSTAYSSDVLVVLFGDGRGTFPTELSISAPYIGGIAAADMDNDGIDDLVAASDSIGVLVNLSNGDGTFDVKSYDAGNDSNQVALGDLDNDGDIDIAVSNNTSPGAITILQNRCGN